MKHSFLTILTLALILASCSQNTVLKKASGVFEATEVLVSAEAAGKLLHFQATEGQKLDKENILGQIDTVQLSLKKMQIIASQLSIEASKPDEASQIRATEREIEKLEFEKERTVKLLEGDVATQKQLDDILAQLDILKARLGAQKKNLSSSIAALDAQKNAMEVQIEQLNDQIFKCQIRSPIEGILLVKFAEEGEFVNMGRPLFKVANLKKMILRAYVTADQLKEIQIGQEVEVMAELGKEEIKSYPGKVSWISSKSEFTPKTIQTQDERANLVYAVKITVENDGILKIGMYGGVNW